MLPEQPFWEHVLVDKLFHFEVTFLLLDTEVADERFITCCGVWPHAGCRDDWVRRRLGIAESPLSGRPQKFGHLDLPVGIAEVYPLGWGGAYTPFLNLVGKEV